MVLSMEQRPFVSHLFSNLPCLNLPNESLLMSICYLRDKRCINELRGRFYTYLGRHRYLGDDVVDFYTLKTLRLAKLPSARVGRPKVPEAKPIAPLT
jgi:hypothetical protein